VLKKEGKDNLEVETYHQELARASERAIDHDCNKGDKYAEGKDTMGSRGSLLVEYDFAVELESALFCGWNNGPRTVDVALQTSIIMVLRGDDPNEYYEKAFKTIYHPGSLW
jgi:hypothetical protein